MSIWDSAFDGVDEPNTSPVSVAPPPPQTKRSIWDSPYGDYGDVGQAAAPAPQIPREPVFGHYTTEAERAALNARRGPALPPTPTTGGGGLNIPRPPEPPTTPIANAAEQMGGLLQNIPNNSLTTGAKAILPTLSAMGQNMGEAFGEAFDFNKQHRVPEGIVETATDLAGAPVGNLLRVIPGINLLQLAGESLSPEYAKASQTPLRDVPGGTGLGVRGLEGIMGALNAGYETVSKPVVGAGSLVQTQAQEALRSNPITREFYRNVPGGQMPLMSADPLLFQKAGTTPQEINNLLLGFAVGANTPEQNKRMEEIARNAYGPQEEYNPVGTNLGAALTDPLSYLDAFGAFNHIGRLQKFKTQLEAATDVGKVGEVLGKQSAFDRLMLNLFSRPVDIKAGQAVTEKMLGLPTKGETNILRRAVTPFTSTPQAKITNVIQRGADAIGPLLADAGRPLAQKVQFLDLAREAAKRDDLMTSALKTYLGSEGLPDSLDMRRAIKGALNFNPAPALNEYKRAQGIVEQLKQGLTPDVAQAASKLGEGYRTVFDQAIDAWKRGELDLNELEQGIQNLAGHRLHADWIDNAAEVLGKKYSTGKPNPFTRLTNWMRSYEGLLYVRANPANLATNIINNFATIGRYGVAPDLTGKSTAELFRRYGNLGGDAGRAVSKATGAVPNQPGAYGSTIPKWIENAPIIKQMGQTWDKAETVARDSARATGMERFMHHNFTPPPLPPEIATYLREAGGERAVTQVQRELQAARNMQEAEAALLKGIKSHASYYDEITDAVNGALSDAAGRPVNLTPEQVADALPLETKDGLRRTVVAAQEKVAGGMAPEQAFREAAREADIYPPAMRLKDVEKRIREIDHGQAALYVNGKVPKQNRAAFDELQAEADELENTRSLLQDELGYTDEEALFGRKPPSPEEPPTAAAPQPVPPQPNAPAGGATLSELVSKRDQLWNELRQFRMGKEWDELLGSEDEIARRWGEVEKLNEQIASENAKLAALAEAKLSGRTGGSVPPEPPTAAVPETVPPEPPIAPQAAAADQMTVRQYVDDYIAGKGRGNTPEDLEYQQFAANHATEIEQEFQRRAAAEAAPAPAAATARTAPDTLAAIQQRAAQLTQPKVNKTLLDEWADLFHEGAPKNEIRAIHKAIAKWTPEQYLEKAQSWVTRGRAEGQTWITMMADMFEDRAHFIIDQIAKGNPKYNTPEMLDRVANGDALAKLLRGGENGFDWTKLGQPFDGRGYESFAQYRRRVTDANIERDFLRPGDTGVSAASTGAAPEPVSGTGATVGGINPVSDVAPPIVGGKSFDIPRYDIREGDTVMYRGSFLKSIGATAQKVEKGERPLMDLRGEIIDARKVGDNVVIKVRWDDGTESGGLYKNFDNVSARDRVPSPEPKGKQAQDEAKLRMIERMAGMSEDVPPVARTSPEVGGVGAAGDVAPSMTDDEWTTWINSKEGRKAIKQEVADAKLTGKYAERNAANHLRERMRVVDTGVVEPSKEIWQMTKSEYVGRNPDVNASQDAINHRAWVEKALSEGKPVPPEVLADYPDLARGAAGDVTPPTSEGNMTLASGEPMPTSFPDELARLNWQGRMKWLKEHAEQLGPEAVVNGNLNRAWNDALTEGALDTVGKAFKQSKPPAGSLPRQIEASARKYLKEAYQPAQNEAKAAANAIGQHYVNSTVMNYSGRWNLDDALGLVAPFSFWWLHTLANYTKDFIDHPAMLAWMVRLGEQIDKQTEGMPEKYMHRIKLPMPLSDKLGLGDSIYIDPMRALFPARDVFQLPALERASYQSVKEDGTVDFNNAFGDLFGIHTPYKVAWALMNGNPEEVRNIAASIPAARLIRGLTSGMTPGGIGLEGEYDKFYLEKAVKELVAEGKLSEEQAQVALLQQTGKDWDAVKQRAGLENYGVRELSGALGLRGYAFTPGEQKFLDAKGQQETLQQEAVKRLGGNPGMTPDQRSKFLTDRGFYKSDEWNQFKEQYPELDTASFINKAYDENGQRLPEDQAQEQRYRDYMISKIWDTYRQAPKLQQRVMAADLGDEFKSLFLDKPEGGAPRDYAKIPTEKLLGWANAVGAALPNVANFEQPLPEAAKVRPIDDTAAQAYQEFYDNVEQSLGWDEVYRLGGYQASLSKADKNAWFQSPEGKRYKEYLNYRDEFFKAHPDVEKLMIQAGLKEPTKTTSSSGGGGGGSSDYVPFYMQPSYNPRVPMPRQPFQNKPFSRSTHTSTRELYALFAALNRKGGGGQQDQRFAPRTAYRGPGQ